MCVCVCERERGGGGVGTNEGAPNADRKKVKKSDRDC